ncbi:hypothetical protein C0993_007129 [Termitomyces sp. T159_Od127]|nr:hypothetical protein C0993_007129 [Termitomyces sp. T159_Od127]
MTPRIFRTYEVEANQGYDCTVVQAARATTATPNLFQPVSISSGGVTETFVGASLGYSNPTSLVLEEAVMAFGSSQPVACLVSLGAGNPGHISWKPNNAAGRRMMELLQKIATDCEASAENLAKYYKQTSGLFYRLSVHQGLQKMAVDEWNKQGEIQTHTLAYLQRNNIGQELKSLTNTLHTCPQKTTLNILSGNLSANSFLKQTSELAQALLPIVPPPSPLFTGRTDILLHLEKYFDPHQSFLKDEVQQCCVLHGLGGTGKTQIALQFCHKFRNRFSSIYMINASSKESIEQFLTLLAQSANLTDKTPAAALTWLCHQKENWLMIFDNADDPDIDLNAFFPACNHGNIIITSRNEASKVYAPENHYKVREMSNEDSLAVFYKASQRPKTEQAAANQLIKELGYVALAIVQAGRYLLYNEHIEVKQYLESYKKDKPKYMAEAKKQQINHYQLSVFATWDLSYQRLDERAKAILMLSSVLHNSNIPVSILKRAWRNISLSCEVDTQEIQDFLQRFVTYDKDWSDKLVEEAIDMLRSYSLLGF